MSVLTIKITHAEFGKSGVSKKGKDYALRLQKGLVTLPSGEIRQVEFTLGERPALEVGKAYKFDPAVALEVDRFGGFAIDSRKIAEAMQ